MPTSSTNFTFGKNWRRFLQSYTPERQKIARDCLLNFLQLPDLKGKTFLDIGSGSGIHSAAAWLAGAERVCSFDYDPDSVTATAQLREHHGSPANWTVMQGSVLDADFIRSLGKFDVVYAWGMLHHTGNQWQALRNAVIPMDTASRLYIALYAKEAYTNWPRWVEIKQRYNKAGKLQKNWMEIHYIWETILGRKILNIFSLPKMMWQYKHSRGMEFMTDVRDWLGGWPTEFSSVPEVVDFAGNNLGMELVNLHTGEGNSEF
jgi:2-polyprenyl-6-hydroxyphenyl methylase/3-demethylubiquinone-9 3-methyltransferase